MTYYFRYGREGGQNERRGKEESEEGADTEEMLANYFRKAGYFVVRGVPFEYSGYSVTDVDLWLYLRSSSVSREIAIVDIKNKKTPQAIERIFWTKGLQAAVGANRAIVATTDARDEVVGFGRRLDVTVLGGRFLRRLEQSDTLGAGRITEEDLSELLSEVTLDKLDGDWRGKLDRAKRQLAHGLSFDAVNLWLEGGKFFAEQASSRAISRGLALRALYRVVSYIAVGVDFILKELAFEGKEEKIGALKSGFTYGSSGERGIAENIDKSLGLLEQFGGDAAINTGVIRANVQKAFRSIRASILGEYFASGSVGKSLVQFAMELDTVSMGVGAPEGAGLSIGCRGLLGCLLDFWGVDRERFGLGELRNEESGARNMGQSQLSEGR